MIDPTLQVLEPALSSLREGRFILLHDSTAREDEVDIVAAAERITPKHVKTMRSEAGGLLCVAISGMIGEKLGLTHMHEIFESASNRYPILGRLDELDTPYGDKPAFSITVNHRRTFTGVTDLDRSLTITELAKLGRKALKDDGDCQDEFVRQFSAPGHVHLLLEAKRSLAERRGHTELSLYLCKLAGLTPVTAICEMLDGETYKALTIRDALVYARDRSITVVDGKQVVENFLATSTSKH